MFVAVVGEVCEFDLRKLEGMDFLLVGREIALVETDVLGVGCLIWGRNIFHVGFVSKKKILLFLTPFFFFLCTLPLLRLLWHSMTMMILVLVK